MYGLAFLLLAICTQQPDLDRIQGTWILVDFVSNGKRATTDVRREIKGDALTDVVSGRVLKPVTLRLDESQVPKIWETESARGITLSIYKLEGDTLTICYPLKRDLPTPTEFVSKTGGNTSLCVFKRATK